MISQQNTDESNHVTVNSSFETNTVNGQASDANEKYLTNINSCLDEIPTPVSMLVDFFEKSQKPINSDINNECTVPQTSEIINISIIDNCTDQRSSLESVSEQSHCLMDNYCSDYDMISESSWDIDMSVSGDEDAIEDEIDAGKKNKHETKSDPTTVENSPNVVCCSAKTPIKTLDGAVFFRKVILKRRNAVRHECRSFHRKPSWAKYRPDDKPCVHSRILADSDCIESNLEDSGVTIEHFIHSCDHTIFSTMNEFRSDAIYGEVPQFTTYSNPINTAKNRYSDIPCVEESRVKLIRNTSNATPHDDGQPAVLLKPTDYIHANWVDGYRQKNAFICTQGPLSTTVSDFWHMIIQYRVPIIVMTTRPREQNREKCLEYWPEKVGESCIIEAVTKEYDSFDVTCLRSKEFGPRCPTNGICEYTNEHWYRVALLQVKNCRTGVTHRVYHFYFHSWPDQGIPYSTEGFLHFILQIRRTYRLNIAKLDYESEMDQIIPPPPILVHCSAGIGRTGTYVVTDICTKSLSDCGRFNLYQTMLKVRSQRYKCVQNCYQYIYCRNTIIDYARQFGMLENYTVPDDSNMDDEDDDDDDEEDLQEFDEQEEEVEEYEEQEVDECDFKEEEEKYEEQIVDGYNGDDVTKEHIVEIVDPDSQVPNITDETTQSDINALTDCTKVQIKN